MIGNSDVNDARGQAGGIDALNVCQVDSERSFMCHRGQSREVDFVGSFETWRLIRSADSYGPTVC
jgi:hypothetical protein